MKLLYPSLRAAVAAVVGLTAASAQAVPVVFSCASNNSGQCPTVVSQVLLDVVDLGGGQASFTFSNSGPVGSTITDIYWRSAGLSAGSIVDSGAGVSFSWGASPANPGGGIAWNASLASDSDAPTGPNGVDPGEWVRFTLGYSGSFDGLIAGIGDSVAIHLQRIGPNDASDWAVATPVPEPHTYALMLAGLGAVGFIARRRRVR